MNAQSCNARRGVAAMFSNICRRCVVARGYKKLPRKFIVKMPESRFKLNCGKLGKNQQKANIRKTPKNTKAKI